MMKEDFDLYLKVFPNARRETIGKSFWGRNIDILKIGNGAKKMLFVGAHHGMEHLTAKLLLTFAFRFETAIQNDFKIGEKEAKVLAENYTLYILPMLNPDGVDLSIFGLSAPDIKNRDFLRKINPSGDFSDWQANARGVDLNHNYDALWDLSKKAEKENGISGPGKTRFSGPHPESEPETFALCRLTDREDFSLVCAFHSQGKVIYHSFFGREPAESKEILKRLEKDSCYRGDYTEGMASFGGFKDWFINKFRKPGFTIEIGEGKNPLPLSMLDTVYDETLPLLVSLLGN